MQELEQITKLQLQREDLVTQVREVFSDSPNVLNAALFAIEKHGEDKRKAGDKLYATHLLAVGLVLREIGADETTQISGWLHDVIEDAHVTKEELEDKFGKDITQIVMNVTEENKKEDWGSRKRKAIAKVADMDGRSLLVKGADAVHNYLDLALGLLREGIDFMNYFNEKSLPVQIEVAENLYDALYKRRLEDPSLNHLLDPYRILLVQLRKINDQSQI